MDSAACRRTRSDRGDMVVGWLVKLVVIAAVIGVVAFDGVSVGVARFTMIDQGQTAARAASESWRTKHDVQQAYAAARSSAERGNPLNTVGTTTFLIDPDGTVHLSIEREATTLVLHKVARAKRWGEITENVSAQWNP